MSGAVGLPGHLVLIGFMGAGKSTVARLLADRLSLPFVDMDRDVELFEGRSVAQIFSQSGEVAFREAERRAVARLRDRPPSVVAAGGGVVLDEDNRVALKKAGTVVYLTVSAGEALSRVGHTGERPLLAGAGPDAAEALLASRTALYEVTADLVVPTIGRAAEDVADDILTRLDGETP